MIIWLFLIFFYLYIFSNNYLINIITNYYNYYLINYFISLNENNIVIISDNFWNNNKVRIKNIIDIDDENSFIDTYSLLNPNKELDIIIQSNGGLISSSDAMINILLTHKNKINVYVLKFAYSAASMISLIGDNIFMNHFSLLSTVDPQLSFEDLNNGEYMPAKTFIDIKKNEKKIDNNMIVRYYESNLLYEDCKRNLNKILFGKYKRSQIKNIINEFSSGKYPHFKQFNTIDLKKLGLNIKEDIPKNIKKIFKLYTKIEDNYKYL